MTDKWEKVHNILTVFALLICLFYGVQRAMLEYQDYVEALSLKDVVSSMCRQEFFQTRFFRQALFTGIDTLLLMSLIILVSRFMYLYLERRVPVWLAEEVQMGASGDINVTVRMIHEEREKQQESCDEWDEW